MLVFSFAILLVFSGNSFLFSMNTWVDTNCYFTMGRSMLHGLKPYIDLYDQKGPLLHIVYYIAALISETTFNGVFIVEVIFAAIFYTRVQN